MAGIVGIAERGAGRARPATRAIGAEAAAGRAFVSAVCRQGNTIASCA
jgi:hypothetical protein